MVWEMKHSPQLEISWCVYHTLRRALFNICKLIHFGPVISFYKFEWITGKSVIRDTLSYQNTMLSTCDFLNSFLKKNQQTTKINNNMQIRSFYDLFKEISAHVISFFFPRPCRLSEFDFIQTGLHFLSTPSKKITYKKRRYLYNQAPYCSSFISCYDNLSP